MSAPNPSSGTDPVAIITDTTASIPDELVNTLNIHLIPYYINIGNKTLRDVFDISREKFYQWLPTATQLPTTSNPGPGDYVRMFRELYERTKEMVVITMTSIGSGAYQAASVAKEMITEELPDIKVDVIDTRQVAMAQGWSVIEAARAALAGASLNRIIEITRQTAARAMMIQTADTLKYLYMGGRIGRAIHLVGTLLNVKPLIGMENGEILAYGQARSRSRAYEKMVSLLAERFGLGTRVKVAYMHAAAPEEVQELRRRVEQIFQCVETIVSELSPALGVHSGPGTTGLAVVPEP
ncbi:MAG: DegV family protein [Anaerolineae bacterium]